MKTTIILYDNYVERLKISEAKEVEQINFINQKIGTHRYFLINDIIEIEGRHYRILDIKNKILKPENEIELILVVDSIQ